MDKNRLKLAEDDKTLIKQALSGNNNALEKLVKKHQDWVFNIAINFVADRNEAADLTQEVLIKIITKLSTFRYESDFKTWMYRIVKNHFLNMKRSKYEAYNPDFKKFGDELDNMKDEPLSDYANDAEQAMLVKEAKVSCMTGMLLCLDREQRMIYIMGELFEFPDSIGSEIMEISKVNFRVKLHRAKEQLYNFMNDKCGLINKNNPCRCARKTAGFIKKGYVDPVNLHFHKNVIDNVNRVVHQKVENYSNEVLSAYRKLYQDKPFLKGPDTSTSIKQLMNTKSVKETFDLGKNN